MKKFVIVLLDLVPLLAPVPTGWAVYAGLRMTAAWPMPAIAAVCGALALIAVNVSVSSYIVDAIAYNKSLRRPDTTGDEPVQPVNIIPGWIILVLALAAEITLALLIGIIPGARTYSILAFPLLAGAGVFTTILRTQLAERIALRDAHRTERRTAKAERTQSEPTAKPKARTPAHRPQTWPDACPHCGASIRSAQAWSSHSGRWCPVLHPKSGAPVVPSVAFEQIARGKP